MNISLRSCSLLVGIALTVPVWADLSPEEELISAAAKKYLPKIADKVEGCAINGIQPSEEANLVESTFFPLVKRLQKSGNAPVLDEIIDFMTWDTKLSAKKVLDLIACARYITGAQESDSEGSNYFIDSLEGWGDLDHDIQGTIVNNFDAIYRKFMLKGKSKEQKVAFLEEHIKNLQDLSRVQNSQDVDYKIIRNVEDSSERQELVDLAIAFAQSSIEITHEFKAPSSWSITKYTFSKWLGWTSTKKDAYEL